jgi:O-acetyl-ADP-ribose deacetylase (regulator of RNase III)
MSNVKFITGDIFNSKAEALVCPSNAQGTLGAGLAKQFRDMGSVSDDFKEANEAYYDVCRKGLMAGGSCMYYEFKQPIGHLKGIVYCATKGYWSLPSKLEYVETGLGNLLKLISYNKINSIAIPLLGAGLGGLPEPTVEFAIKSAFDHNQQNCSVEVWRFKK